MPTTKAKPKQPIEQSDQQPAEQAAKKPAKQPAEKPAPQSTQQSAPQPVQQSAPQPAHHPVQQPIQQLVQQPLQQTFNAVGLKTGVFFDVSNIMLNGGHGMRYDVLRKFAARDGAQIMRLNAYVSYDRKRAEDDPDYYAGQMRFHAALRDLGYKVILKEVRWYSDGEGKQVGKSNVDMDLAVDALAQAEHLDRVILVTGDGDFAQLVRALQNKGCSVETLAFSNSSYALRQESDVYVSGYLLPNLLPVKLQPEETKVEWGQIGSYVRGICLSYDTIKNFGFLRYLSTWEGDLWRTDYRDPLTPYKTIFFHESELIDPENIVNINKMTHRKYIFEFRISHGQEDQTKATDIHPIFAPF